MEKYQILCFWYFEIIVLRVSTPPPIDSWTLSKYSERSKSKKMENAEKNSFLGIFKWMISYTIVSHTNTHMPIISYSKPFHLRAQPMFVANYNNQLTLSSYVCFRDYSCTLHLMDLRRKHFQAYDN